MEKVEKLPELRKVWKPRQRRFGSLCFVLKEPREKVCKLETRYRPAIFLGYGDSNRSWLCGFYNNKESNKTISGVAWMVAESKDVKFLEHRTVQNCEVRRLILSGGPVRLRELANYPGLRLVNRLIMALRVFVWGARASN